MHLFTYLIAEINASRVLMTLVAYMLPYATYEYSLAFQLALRKFRFPVTLIIITEVFHFSAVSSLKADFLVSVIFLLLSNFLECSFLLPSSDVKRSNCNCNL